MWLFRVQHGYLGVFRTSITPMNSGQTLHHFKAYKHDAGANSPLFHKNSALNNLDFPTLYELAFLLHLAFELREDSESELENK